jgi:hypothetical protein
MRNAIMIVLVTTGCAAASQPRPVGKQGPEADVLANKMLHDVNAAAWADTKAVTWNFAGKRTHLWDRERNFDLYREGTREVLLRIDDKTGVVRDNGVVVSGDGAATALEDAWAAWINDSFWLNAPVKCFDDGVERSVVHDKDGDHLLVAYTSGGKTPGDAYLWDIGNDKPTAWHMWTHVIPIGGVTASWEGWEQLPTGAWIATVHKMAASTLAVSDVRGAATLAELSPGADPFAELVSQ